ncbi:MAG: hypothetical protein QOE51_4626 [Actinoplanes sp.]|jgi:aspartate aminotransferase-like enzyme|nr:hypothetical protein [Actinoplanes sp.]
MTARKFSISVPEDVAAAMEVVAPGEVSAYVTEALRRRQNGDAIRATLAEQGFSEYPLNPEASAARVTAAHVREGVRSRAIERLAAMTGEPAAAVRQQLDGSASAAGW